MKEPSNTIQEEVGTLKQQRRQIMIDSKTWEVVINFMENNDCKSYSEAIRKILRNLEN